MEVSPTRGLLRDKVTSALALIAVVITAAAQDAKDNAEIDRQLKLLEWTARDYRPETSLSQFVRIVSMWSDDRTMLTAALQTSVRCLRKPGTDNRIILLAMHHYGEAAYFRALTRFCAHADVILTEGYDPDGAAHGELCELVRLIARYQQAITRRLNLVHQSTWKKVSKGASWQSLDMSLREFNEACAKLPPAAVSGQRKAVEFVEGDASDAAVYEHVLLNVTEATRITNPLLHIDGARERIILDGLKDVVERGLSREIVLMYGALHAASLERKIVTDLGYQLEWSIWVDVLRYSRKA